MLAPPFGTLDSPLDTVWSGGGLATSTEVPDPFIVSIEGHNYLHDLEFKPWKRQAMRATTTQTTRTQADTSNEPGEQSLSTEQLWRRTQDSWHEGANQVFLDRKNSTEFGFRQSKGINPWTQWQLTLLNDVVQSYSSLNSNVQMVVCGTHLYLIDGQLLKYTADLITFHTVTGTPAVQASSIASDGHSVYVAYGASGLYTTTEAAGAATQMVTSALDSKAIVRFVMGRLLIGNLDSIYNVIAAGPAALPAAIIQSNYNNLLWVDFSVGNGCIFAAGNSGNVGVIYSIQLLTDASALGSPIICGQMPNGETVNCIYGYAGSGVAIGTNLGWRFSEQTLADNVAGTVSLTIGPLTTTPSPVTAFSGYNRFIWGTYEDYDPTSTGLFRMDPSVFVADLVPAWASDLMAPDQGPITSVVHFQGPTSGAISTPVFAVAGVGVFSQSLDLVNEGSIDSGFITYGIADNKMPVFVDITMLPTFDNQSIETLVSLDSGEFVAAGTAQSNGLTFQEFNTQQVLCQTMEIREILMPGDNATDGPTLTRHTLRSVPAPQAPTDWNVVIQLREMVLIKDVENYLVPSEEYAFLDSLRINKVIATLQVGNLGPYNVTIETIDWIPEQNATLSGELNGVAVITARTVV